MVLHLEVGDENIFITISLNVGQVLLLFVVVGHVRAADIYGVAVVLLYLEHLFDVSGKILVIVS